jgi:hypothetical protein
MAGDPEKRRAAKRRYYERNKLLYFERNRRKRDELRDILRRAKEKPCADCGGEFPYYVMDLDHRADDKKIEVAQIVALNWGKDRLLAEIEKCDVVCANCHRVRTHERGQYAGGRRAV